MTEAIIITLITGFISIISILIKYRLDTNKNTKEIKNLVEEISANDKRQNENITGLNNRIDYLNGDIKKIDATLNKFIYDEQLVNKINQKYIDMQYDLSKVIIKDIQNEEHNGDLVSAKQKIDDFKETVEGFYGN